MAKVSRCRAADMKPGKTVALGSHRHQTRRSCTKGGRRVKPRIIGLLRSGASLPTAEQCSITNSLRACCVRPQLTAGLITQQTAGCEDVHMPTGIRRVGARTNGIVGPVSSEFSLSYRDPRACVNGVNGNEGGSSSKGRLLKSGILIPAAGSSSFVPERIFDAAMIRGVLLSLLSNVNNRPGAAGTRAC